MKYIVFLLALALPIIGSICLLQWDHELRQTSRIDQARENLTEILSNVARLSQPEFYFQEKMTRIKRALQWDAPPLSHLSPRDVASLKVFLFDGAGKRVTGQGFAEGLVNASEQCFATLRKIAGNPAYRTNAREARLMASFLGGGVSGDEIALQTGKFSGFGEIGIERLAGIFPFRDMRGKRGFLLGIVDMSKVHEDELVAENLDRLYRKLSAGYSFGVRDLSGATDEQLFGREAFPADIPPDAMVPDVSTVSVRGGELIGTAVIGRRFQVIGSCPLPMPPATTADTITIALAGLSLIVGGIAVGRRLFIPIRVQVIGLFGLAGLGGFFTLLGFGHTYLDIRREALIRQSFEQARSILQKADDQFLSFRHQKSLRLRPITASIKRLPEDLPAAIRQLERLRALKNLVSVYLVGSDGTVFWKHEPGNLSSLKQFFGDEYLSVLRQINAGAMRRHEIKAFGRTAAPGATTAGLEQELFGHQVGARLYTVRGSIGAVTLGQKSILNFYDIASDNQQRPLASLFVVFEARCLERAFFARWKKMMRRDTAVSNDLFLPLSPKGPVKAGGLAGYKDALSDVRILNDIVSQTRSPGFRISRAAGAPVLVAASPAKNFDETNLFFLSSLKPIEVEFDRMKRRFYSMAFVFLGFALALGWVCSRLLVRPLNELSMSVKDLAQSRFTSPPSIVTGDLFEEISLGIRDIMAEFAELATARQVQEQLFPHEPLSSAGWLCRGWFRSRSDLGGEIYDHHQIGKTDRIAFWIAGIRGGKIESALRLAMSKMALRLLLEQPTQSPSSVTAELSRLFFQTPESAGSMSLFLGTADQETGDIRFCCKGRFVAAIQAAAGTEWDVRATAPSETTETEYQMALGPGARMAVFSAGWFDDVLPAKEDARIIILSNILSNHTHTLSDVFGEAVFTTADDGYSEVASAECRIALVLDRGGAS